MNKDIKLTGHSDIDELLLKTYAIYQEVEDLKEEIMEALEYELGPMK